MTSALVCVLCLPLAFASPSPRLHLLTRASMEGLVEGRSGFGVPPADFVSGDDEPADHWSATSLAWTGAELLVGAGGATVAALRGYGGARIALDLGLAAGIGAAISITMAIIGFETGILNGNTGSISGACATFLTALLLVAVGAVVGLLVAPPLGLIAAEGLQGHSPGVGGWAVAQGGTALAVVFAGVALTFADEKGGGNRTFLPVVAAAPVAAAGAALGFYSLLRR